MMRCRNSGAYGRWLFGIGDRPFRPNHGVSTKPGQLHIVTIISDDTGYWDLGAYHGGKARGMDTPNLDGMARNGMMFTDFYGQPSCTPGRAAMMTGRYPNRSGMTTVAFQGQGGGLPKGEWTLASVLKKGGYNTYFVGKWHLGEADYAMPIAHGFDKMENVLLYHLSALTYGLPDWFPQMSPEQKAFFRKVTKGILEGVAGKPARETIPYSKVTTETLADLDVVTTQKSVAELERLAKAGKPFFMSINFAANHQPNLPSKCCATSRSAGIRTGGHSARRGGPGRLPLRLSHAASVAVPFNHDDLRMVDEPIDEGGRDRRIGEDRRPVAER
jgi:arylsulfatase